MLDAIRQQIAIEAPQKLSSVPPPNPSAPEAAVFGHMMQTPTEPDRVEPTAPKHDEDRGDLGVGWDTSDPMDVDRYDDPALAAAAEPTETVETAPAEPQAYGEQASVAQANAEASEAAMPASQVAAEQAARSAAVIEQLQTGASAGPPVNAAAQLAAASAAELAANLAQMAPGDTEARQMQAALDATQPQDRSGVEAKGELLGELAGLQEAESADKAGPHRPTSRRSSRFVRRPA